MEKVVSSSCISYNPSIIFKKDKWKDVYKTMLTEDVKITKTVPILCMTIGIPGSSKSTWAKSQKGFEIVCPDEIRKELTGTISDQSKNGEVWEVWKVAAQRVVEFLKDGKNVILDATNTTTKGRTQFLKNIPNDLIYQKQAIVFDVSPEDAKKRIKKDLEDGKDRSNVPDDVIDRMYKQFKQDIGNLEREGFEIL